MPELPEVQTIVSQLGKKAPGKVIIAVSSEWKKRVLPSFLVFSRQVRGATVSAVRRFGKHIVIDLNNGYSIVIHLKMTGHLLWKTPKNRWSDAFTRDPYNGFIRHSLLFSDETTLEFSDMRKFGWLHAMKTEEVESLPAIRDLGIDALSPMLTTKRFRELIMFRSQRTIGEVLLEQGVIAGIGNIYRSEALFLAGVRPDRLVASLAVDEWRGIVLAVKKVLRHAARLGGLSGGDFRDTDGKDGRFQRVAYVYQRDGSPCKKCGTMIKRKKLGQRSVFYCSCCQK